MTEHLTQDDVDRIVATRTSRLRRQLEQKTTALTEVTTDRDLWKARAKTNLGALEELRKAHRALLDQLNRKGAAK